MMHNSAITLLPQADSLTLQFLNAAHAADLFQLQTSVFNNLPAAQKHFIVPKSERYFKDHFNRANNWAIGAYFGSNLVGQCIIVNPCDFHPQTGMVDMEPLACPKSHISVLQGLLVLPEYRGHKIGAQLIATWIDACTASGKTHLLSETATDNQHSWSLFLNAGIPIVSWGRDPDDNTAVFNHLKVLQEVNYD